MRIRVWHVMLAGFAVAALFGLTPRAQAFFPMGVFASEDQYSDQTLRLATWPLRYLDANGDGDVSGDEDGVPITFEGGTGGWTRQEQLAMQQGLETWERVPTAYAAFTFTQPIEQQMETSVDVGASDFFNFVANDAGPVPAGAVGIVLTSFIPLDTYLTVNGRTVPVTGPALIDVDTAIDGDSTQIKDEIDLGTIEGLVSANVPLKAAITHAGGLILGLSYSPMSSFQEADVIGDDVLTTIDIDPRVYAARDVTGAIQLVGVTPTMYPALFFYEQGNNVFRCSWEDLAPDDIAGISFLYPRGDQEGFFELAQEARTIARQGFTSAPIAGGFIQAWCDVDNNAATPRVPMFSTITSLYETNALFSGRFRMINMLKQIENSTGGLFSATYTFTLSEVPAVGTPTSEPTTPETPTTPTPKAGEEFDSTHAGLLGGGGGFAFTTGYPWQTYVEGGQNIFSLDRHDEGTPLMFDLTRRKVISVNTGLTLEQILPGTRPMFGDSDAENICPANIVGEALKSDRIPQAMRQFRDGVLLNSALGVAVADAYYRVAPSISAFMTSHRIVFTAALAVARVVDWSLAYWKPLGIGAAFVAVGLTIRGYRARKTARALASIAIIMAVCLIAAPAEAQLLKTSTEKMVALSTDIVTGQVVAKECRWTEKHQIITDVTIQVDDTVKGRLNKSGLVHFSQLGGSKDGIVTYVPQYPSWTKGEEVAVFLKEHDQYGYMAVCGAGGKFKVVQDADTGKKYVDAPSVPAKINLDKAAAGMKKVKAEKKTEEDQQKDAKQGGQNGERVSLDDFKQYIRGIVKQQEKSAK